MDRQTTKSWLEGKKRVLVPVAKVRPTNIASENLLTIKYLPIILIKAIDDYYYIVDGNHRFFKMLYLQHHSISAWILEEGDQHRLRGDPLPQVLGEWKEGEVSLTELCIKAISAYEKIKEKVSTTGGFYPGAVQDKGIQAKDIVDSLDKFKGEDCDTLALDLAVSIVNLIQGTTSLKKAASANNISEEELSSLHKCFIDGGIKAIKERLKSQS